MRSQSTFETLDVVRVFATGVIGGLMAGVILAAAQMLAAVVQGLPASAPLQAIAAILIGPELLVEPRLDMPTALIGVATHFVLSATYGTILAVLAMAIFAVGTSRWGSVLTGMIFGFVLWLINFFLIAPIAFPWFSAYNQGVQLALHVLFYGAPLGYIMGRSLTHEPRPGT